MDTVQLYCYPPVMHLMSLRGLSVGLGLLAVVGTSACKDDEPGEAIDRAKVADQLVAAICDPFVACDCEEGSQLDENNDCDEATRPILEAATANAQDLALRYHAECVRRLSDYFGLLQCDSFEEVDEDALEKALFDVSQCKLVAGRGSRGQPCEVIGGPSSAVSVGDTCSHDLFCDGVLCRPFPTKQGDWCGGSSPCPPGLSCLDPEGDGVLLCSVSAVKNDGCNPHDGPGACDVDLYCDPDDSECKELPDEGDACLGSLCKDGLVCLSEICEELPGRGDPCPAGLCDPTEAVCDVATMACVSLPDEGEACITGVCDKGLQCGADGTCEELAAAVCGFVEDVGLCLYQGDGICDEPDDGTGLCPDGTDPLDCMGGTGDPTFTSGDPTFTSGDPTFTSGDPTFTSGDPTFTSGDPTFTSGDPTFTTGDPTTGDPTFTTTSTGTTSGDTTGTSTG